MAENPNVKFEHYVFDCDPMPMADGRFGAQITITFVGGKDGGWSKRFPALAYFGTSDEAIRYAKGWGMAWVKDNG